MKKLNRINYFLWAALNYFARDQRCPFCGSDMIQLVIRKNLVTRLYECNSCHIRFRLPKDSPERSNDFYQRNYSQGFTTDCPNDIELSKLTASAFRGTEKDYSTYMNVLTACGLKPGQTILDFGASWGYGSWQLMQAGYNVFSVEVSKPRAKYAIEKLNCKMIEDTGLLAHQVDCLFSAHVLEHLPYPSLFWNLAKQVLKPDGIIVVFVPNGNPDREAIPEAHYHQLWGQVHPLLLTPRSLIEMGKRTGFGGHTYASPYNFHEIRAGQGASNLNGGELLFIGSPSRT